MQFPTLVTTSQHVASTRSRLKKIALLAATLKGLNDDEREIGVSYLMGAIRQQKTGMGYAAVRDANDLLLTSRKDFANAALSADGTLSADDAVAPQEALSADGAISTGDDSPVPEPLRSLDPPPSLTEVDATLTEIAETSGTGSKARKRDLLVSLLARLNEAGRDYLSRLIVGEVRQGALEGVLVEAIAEASERPAAQIRRAAMLGGDLRAVANVAFRGESLDAFRLEVFRPLQPMLAQTAQSPEEVLERFPVASFERKLDGARIQVHKSGEQVRVFTRRLNEVTHAVPEVIEAVRAIEADSLVLDGEAIAIGKKGEPLPFQVTMRRFGRRLDVAKMRVQLPLSCFFFDLLFLNGEEWIDRPYRERREKLLSLLAPETHVPGDFYDNAEQAEDFFAEQIANGHEGLVAKDPDSPYEAGRRGSSWLKIKPAHTLDLVVLAVEPGSGRREGWLSNLHLGARDEQSGEFIMVGKTFKGMTDQVLAWQTEALREIAIDTPHPLVREYADYSSSYVVRVEPQLVVEIAFDGVQESPQYPGGVALRFARLRGYRDDKNAGASDTIDSVKSRLSGK